MYCLRSPGGDWEPLVICLLPDARSADVDFTSGSGVMVAAGSWYAEDHELVVEDTARRPREPARQRYRRFSATRVNGRAALVGYADGRDDSGQSAGRPLTYVLASTDCSVEQEVSAGQYEQVPVQQLILQFQRETRRQQRIASDPPRPTRQTEAPPREEPVRRPSPPFSGAAPPRHSTNDAPARTSGAARRLTPEDSPYLSNPFRVLGLPTTADARDVSRRAKELAMRAQLDDDDEQSQRLREAEAALADPVRRFADELLWLRSGPNGPPAGIDLLDEAAVTAALDQFTVAARSGADEAVHDLAVLAHAVVLEDAAASNSLWQVALSAWGKLLARERFWQAARARAELIGDPRLTGQTVDTVRADLPRKLLEPTARAIGRLVRSQRDDEATACLQAVASSGLPSDEVARARTLATATLRTELATAEAELADARSAFDRDTNASALRTAADRVADRATAVLGRLARLDPQSPEARIRADELAEALRLASIRLHNDADDTTGAANLAQRAVSIAVSESVRGRLTTDVRMLWRLAAQRRANDLAGREDWAGATRELTVALQYVDDAEARGETERSLAICRTNAAMKRALKAAEARDWATAVSAAEEARATAVSPDERANIDGFIARCRQGVAVPRASSSSVTRVASGKLVLAWLFALALVLLANQGIVAPPTPPVTASVAMDGAVARIRGLAGQVVSGSIASGASLDGRMAYPSGLVLVVDIDPGRQDRQEIMSPVQQVWSETVWAPVYAGNRAATGQVSVRIPSTPPSHLRGRITGPTRFPWQTGPSKFETRSGEVALDVEIEVLSNIGAQYLRYQGALFAVQNFVKSWSAIIGLGLFFTFWGIVPPWLGSKFRGASGTD